jgi:membrane protease YdiL (CAAX protease family)
MNEHAAPVSDERVGARAATLPFFVMALGFTWLLQVPALLARQGVIAGPVERYMPLGGLGAFGPLFAAIAAARLEAGAPGVRALFARTAIWRMAPFWYAVALGIFAASYVAGSAVYRVLGGTDAGQWLYLPERAVHVAAMVMMPLVEEPGWRGFALPRLQARYGALRSSLILGVLWAFWHTMMFIVQGATGVMFAISIANIIVGSVIFSWIYNRTRGSLLLAILAHVGVHWNNPTHALPANLTPFAVYTVAIGVVGFALVIGDRTAWKNAPAPGR